MRIQIKGPETHLNLYFPTGLMCSRLVLGTAFSLMHRKYHLPMTAGQAGCFARVLRQVRRTHPNWVLVEVESADGERIRITM